MLGYLEEIIIVFELFYGFLVASMLWFYLLLRVKVYFYIDIFNNIACKLIGPWILFENSLLVSNMELVDDNFNDLFGIFLEIYDQFALLLFWEKLL